MFRGRLIGMVVLLGCAAGSRAPSGSASPPSAAHAGAVALLHGRIFTADVAHPWAAALGFEGERISVVGSDDEVRRWAAARGGVRFVDLGGRVVIPGWNDAHVHEPEVFFDHQEVAGDDPSAEELLATLAQASGASPGIWLRGNLGPRLLDALHTGRKVLDRWALDRVAPDHPVWLEGAGGHVALLNSLALRRLDVPENPPDEVGSWFGRDAAGRPDGYVHEWAKWRLDVRIAASQDDAHVLAAIEKVSSRAIRAGVTTLQTMPNIDPGRLLALVERARSPVRWRIIRTPSAGVTEPAGSSGASPTVMARLDGVKYLLDGSPLEGWAAMRVPYADRPGWTGRIDLSDAQIRRFLAEAMRGKEPLLVHCVGDRCTEMLIGAMEVTASPEAWRPLRVRLEHGDGLVPDLRARAARLGLVVVENPTHFALGDLFGRRFGGAVAKELQPLRSLAADGFALALGTDGPPSPFENLAFAVTHPARPGEALSREDAVAAHTRGSAFAEFAEREKGTLTPGMVADLAVLTQDIFTVPVERLPATESCLTVVGGRIVFDARAMGP
jgi:predicted amidohydrolase YtcJ